MKTIFNNVLEKKTELIKKCLQIIAVGFYKFKATLFKILRVFACIHTCCHLCVMMYMLSSEDNSKIVYCVLSCGFWALHTG